MSADGAEMTSGESEEGSLGASISWLALGNVIYSIGQWLMLIAIARIGDQEAVGVFALGLALSAPVFAVTGLNLRIVVATDFTSSHRLADYFTVRLVTTVVALFGVAGVVAALRLDWSVALVVMAIAVSKSIEAVSDLLYGLFQREGKMDRVGLSMVLRSLLGVPGFILVYAATNELGLAVLALSVAWAVVLVFHDLNRSRRALQEASLRGEGGTGVRRAEWFAITRRAFPLGLAAGANAATVNAPRYAVAAIQGNAALGRFASILYLIRAADTVGMGVRHAVAPRLARLYRDGAVDGFRSLMNRSSYAILSVGAVGLVGAVVMGEPLIELLFGSEYVNQALLVATVVAGTAMIGFEFLEYALVAVGAYRASLVVRLVVFGLVAVGSPLSASVLDLAGPAWSLALGFGIGAVVVVVLLERHRWPGSGPSREAQNREQPA